FQSHVDEQGNYLTFPRFDLGAAIAKNALLGNSLPSGGKDEIRLGLKVALPLFRSLDQTGTALSCIDQYIPLLVAGLRLIGQIKPVEDILHHLKYKSTWKWYCTPSADIGLSTNVGISEVLLR